MELYYCSNCEREHCLHPSFERASVGRSKSKRGISTTVKKNPNSLFNSRISSNKDLQLTTKTSSGFKLCGDVHPNLDEQQVTYHKINQIGRMISMPQSTPPKPRQEKWTEPGFINRLFVEVQFSHQDLFTPIKQFESTPSQRFIDRKNQYFSDNNAEHRGRERPILRQKSFITPHEPRKDAFDEFQNQYGFEVEMKKQGEIVVEPGSVIQLNGRSRSYRKKVSLS